MDKSKMLLVLPSFGDCGLLISLVSGRSHHTPGLVRVLNRELRAKSLTMRLEHDLPTLSRGTIFSASQTWT